MNAAAAGHSGIVSLLLEHGADANFVDKLGKTPLSCAEGLQNDFMTQEMDPNASANYFSVVAVLYDFFQTHPTEINNP
jgi:ankyrin repeat protein